MTSGQGCPLIQGRTSQFVYGVMSAGDWYLGSTSLTFTSTSTAWTVREGGTFIEPSSLATLIPRRDDTIEGPYNLPFTFSYPGGAGSTTAIDVGSNGRVFFEAGTSTFRGGWTASAHIANMLIDTPSVAVLAVDLHPGEGGYQTFETRTVGGNSVALITWHDVPEYVIHGANTVQCQLWDNGNVALCYRNINGAAGLQNALVGISVGGGIPDPGPTDLRPPMKLGIGGAPAIGGSFEIVAYRVPWGTALAQLLVATSTPATPIALSPYGLDPDCHLLVSPVVGGVPMTLTAPTATASITLPYVPANLGLAFELQAMAIDPAQIGAATPIVLSDRGSVTFGEVPALRFVVEGENSYFGNPDHHGFFRLESRTGAAHLDIVKLEVSVLGQPHYFDTSGNAGVDGQGHFGDGNGGSAGCHNAFYGSDVTTSLVYGSPQPPSACDPTGFSGWIGRNPEPGSSDWFNTLEFNFAPGGFQAGETFGFDCDTEDRQFRAGHHAVTVTVTFSDRSTVSATTTQVSPTRAEATLVQ